MNIELLSRIGLLGALSCLAASPSFAQETLVTISVEPRGVPYQVDGTGYYAPTSFVWPKGSKHILEIAIYCITSPTAPIPDACQSRYKPSWATNVGLIGESTVLVVTADPAITFYKGSTSPEHRIRLALRNTGGLPVSPIPLTALLGSKCLGPRPSSGAPGLACVNGQCFQEGVDLWLPPGDIVLHAIPYDGFVFRGWYTGGLAEPFVTSYKVTGPATLSPQFQAGKRVQIVTDPPQLRVLVDRTEINTSHPEDRNLSCAAPGYFDFAEGSTHVLRAISPQVDLSGRDVVFGSWSNGQPQEMLYTAKDANVADVLVAKFVPGVRVSFLLPQGLRLIVDGRDSWPAYNFIWGLGTNHTVTAPAEQTDPTTGRRYVFKGWSNGGAATQEIALGTTDLVGVRLIADYTLLGMVSVHSNFPITIRIDEQTCQTPCTLHREPGTELRIAAPKTVALSEGSRLELQSLSGEKSGVRIAKLGAEAVTLTANYMPTYRVSATAEPAAGANLRIEPNAEDHYYPANTRVQVYSMSRLGYRFKHWDGDATDRFSPATVVVSGPLRLKAILEVIPEISPAGVKNAAGQGPIGGVAPGSVISVFGANLAPVTEAGPSNPLKQTLAGVTVHVAGRILPLYFVSPEQINAQLPYDLIVGTETLVVKNKSMPDVGVTFDLVRNAPGLLTASQNGRKMATATRLSGLPITAQNPVVGGEIINIFGTGFGPYVISPPEGFGVGEADGYRLTDPIQVMIGDRTVVPEYAGPAAAVPGFIVLRLRMPEALSDHTLTYLKGVVNGIGSNEVVLPSAPAYIEVAGDTPP